MALYDGFFDGVEGGVHEDGTTKYDREYGGTDFTNYFGQIVGSGVCIHDNPDSFKAEFEGGTLYLRPGYLFIRGYWLANVPGENDDPASYKGYAVTIPATQTGPVAVVAHLNLGQKIIEIETRSVSQAYPDSLVLAIVDASAAEDTRHNTDICGVIDSAGSLSGKIEYAINYINNEIDGKLEQIESDIAEHELKLDAKIAEAQAVVDKIAPPPVGTIKFSASQDVGEEWLRCDGSFVNETDYPELVNLLKKSPYIPPGITELSPFPEIFVSSTNMIYYDSRVWFYYHNDNVLVGISVSGSETKKISVNNAPSSCVISITEGENYCHLHFTPIMINFNLTDNEEGAVSGKVYVDSYTLSCNVVRNFNPNADAITVENISKKISDVPNNTYRYMADNIDSSNRGGTALGIGGKDYSLGGAFTLCDKASWTNASDGSSKYRRFIRYIAYVAFTNDGQLSAEFIQLNHDYKSMTSHDKILVFFYEQHQLFN